VGGQTLMILTPAGFRARYGLAAPNPRRGMLFAAFDLAVADLDEAARFAGKDGQRREGAIVVPPAPGLDAILAFRSAADA
jgi:hypothetical protein